MCGMNICCFAVCIRNVEFDQICPIYENSGPLFEILSINKTPRSKLLEISEQEILKEIRNRSSFLLNVGLDYLSLNRSSQTLSGGEAQRIRLATQIGSELTGVLYILEAACCLFLML